MTSLNCRPVAQVFTIDGDLRKLLMKKLWPKENFSTPQYIDKTWESYLQCAVDLGIKGADALLAELKKHDRLMFDFEQQ